MPTKNVEIKRVSTGFFYIIVDGELRGDIFNGCAGASGRGFNHYGICVKATQKIRWCGSLQRAKRIAADMANRGEL